MMLRFIVIDRKIRHRISSVEEMEVYSTLMTCVLTWKKQKLNLFEKLLEVLGANLNAYSNSQSVPEIWN